MNDRLDAVEGLSLGINAGLPVLEEGQAIGHYDIRIYDASGDLVRELLAQNVVATVGKNQMLDSALAGSSYTVTGPFLGLISSTSFSAVSASDTMSSHAGWLEAGGANSPTYSGNRATASWSSASGGSKSLASAGVFNMTNSGTIQGVFMTYGSGAVNTVGSTAGVLFSAGTLASPAVVQNGYTVSASYTISL